MRLGTLVAAGLLASVAAHAAGSALVHAPEPEILIAASRGGEVSTVGSLKDMVAGSKVTSVRQDAVSEPVKASETDRRRDVRKPSTRTAVDPVRKVEAETARPAERRRAETLEPAGTARTPATDAAAVRKPVSATAVPPVAVLLRKGVTDTRAASETSERSEESPVEETKTADPLHSETARPLRTPKARARETRREARPVADPSKSRPAVRPSKARAKTGTSKAKPVDEASKAVSTTERTKARRVAETSKIEPATETKTVEAVATKRLDPEKRRNEARKIDETEPARVVEKKTKKQKPRKRAARASRRGGKADTRRGGARVTSKTGHSNASGRRQARRGDQGNAARSNYRGQVMRRLQRAKRYPASARGVSGTVVVRFTVSRSGGVGGIAVVRSSGHSVLDRAAIAMVRRASPMPRFPDGMGRSSIRFAVPVRYSR